MGAVSGPVPRSAAARYSGYSRSGRRVRCPDWSAEAFDATVGRMFGLKGMT